MEPINIAPAIRVALGVMPQLNQILTDKQVTVGEAIDLVADLARATAREAGVYDDVVVVTQQDDK